MSTKGTPKEWLSREQIDSVIESLSAADLMDAQVEAKDNPVRMVQLAFDAAAKRLGLSNGSRATEQVSLGDYQYLAQKVTEATDVSGPLSPDTGKLLNSAATGE